MKRFNRTRAAHLFAVVFCVLGLFGLVAAPVEAMQAARDGLVLCANVLIPSLFPFMVATNLFIGLGLAGYLGRGLHFIMRPLFRLPGACAPVVALGLIGGYPVGARAAAALYESGGCTKAECERLLSFCNNSGPAFILGTVGAAVFQSRAAGVLLYLAHIAAALTVGLLFRFYRGGGGSRPATAPVPSKVCRLSETFVSSVAAGAASIINVCAFVIVFAVVIRLLFFFGIIPALASGISAVLRIDSAGIQNFFTGFLEMSSGVWSLKSSAAGMGPRLCLAAFMLGWAGVCVHCQVLSFLSKSDLSLLPYACGKLLHGVLSSLYAILLFSLCGGADSAFLNLQSGLQAANIFSSFFVLPPPVCLALCLSLPACALIIQIVKKRRRHSAFIYGKSRGKGV